MVQYFCPLKIKITQFPADGFFLNSNNNRINKSSPGNFAVAWDQVPWWGKSFSSPEPPGGLRTRTRTIWGHRIWSPRFWKFRSFPIQKKVGGFSFKSFDHLNLQSLKLLQEQVNAIRNVVENQKWPEVLNTRTSNLVSPEPPGPRTQAPRRLWGRDWGNGEIGKYNRRARVSPFLRRLLLENL